MPGTVAKAYGGIQPFARQIHAVVVRQQPQVDMTVQLLKLAQAWNQPTNRKRAHYAYGQNLARTRRGDLLQRLGNALKALRHRRPQGLALVGQGQPARQAAKQRLAQPVFQIANVLADGGLGDMQFLGRTRQAQMARCGVEHTQCIEGELHGYV